MLSRKIRRTPYQSHEMHGNSPMDQAGVSALIQSQPTYKVPAMDATSQNHSAARAVLYGRDCSTDLESDMVRMSGNETKVSSRLRKTQWDSRFRSGQIGCRTGDPCRGASPARYRWRQVVLCRPSRNRATIRGVRFPAVRPGCSPARRCPRLPNARLGHCKYPGRPSGLQHGGRGCRQ